MKLFRERLLLFVRTHTVHRSVQYRRIAKEIFALLGCYTALICRYGRFFSDCFTLEDETETSLTTVRRCVTSQNSERSYIAKFRSVRAGGTYAYHYGLRSSVLSFETSFFVIYEAGWLSQRPFDVRVSIGCNNWVSLYQDRVDSICVTHTM
jgi:hypothetical protein